MNCEAVHPPTPGAGPAVRPGHADEPDHPPLRMVRVRGIPSVRDHRRLPLGGAGILALPRRGA